MNRVWYRGQLTDGDIAISPFDRGLTLGDGLFETMLVLNGVALSCDDHIARLAASAAQLGITCPHDEIATAVSALCRDVKSHHVLRLTLTRGAAARGLAVDTPDCTFIAALQPFNPGLMFQPTGLRLVSLRRNETSAASRMKTTSYMDQILAAREARQDSDDEALMLNSKGMLASATIGNVFLTFGNSLVTPSLDQGILPGIMRKSVLTVAAAAGFSTEERAVTVTELEKADGVFLTNALRFLCPSRRHTRQDFSALIDRLCAAARADCGVDPRTGSAG